jgi:hypothetical protein
MATTTAVLLVPGFFGYGAFGPSGQPPLLEYFAGVRQILQPALPGWFVEAHDPPPTGSLDERVASLHDAVDKLLRGERLPHARDTFKADLVHLVGHSTGGVDARLFASRKFRWKGGPEGEERERPRAALGEIVTLSAPFKGTPVAKHGRLLRDGALAVVQRLTMLGTFKNGELDTALLRGAHTDAAALLTGLLRLGRLVDVAGNAARARGASSADAEEVRKQVNDFIQKILEDRQLLDDLTVEHMTQVNARIEGGDDLSRMHSYVTVSPAPPLVDIGTDLVARIIYRILYWATARDPMSEEAPVGPALSPKSPVPRLVADKVSCDGVVPTRSQTIDGKAARIVLGDHLDVVGSFRHGSGADVMRSRCDFAMSTFEKLWTEIAAVLRTSKGRRNSAPAGRAAE